MNCDNRRLIRLVFASAVGLPLLAASCGSGHSKASGPNVTTTAAATTSTTLPPPDSARLQMILLQDSDLPAGWTAKAPTPTPDAESAATQVALVQCLGTPNTDPQRVAHVESQNYDMAQASISSHASSYPSEDAVASDTAALSGPKASSCFDQQLRAGFAKELPAGTKVVDGSFRIAPGSGGGPSNLAAVGTGTYTFTVSGQQFKLFLDVAFIRGPRIEADVSFFNIGQQVPSQLRANLINAVAARAAQG